MWKKNQKLSSGHKGRKQQAVALELEFDEPLLTLQVGLVNSCTCYVYGTVFFYKAFSCWLDDHGLQWFVNLRVIFMSLEVVYFTVWICHPHIFIYEANFSISVLGHFMSVKDKKEMRDLWEKEEYFFPIDKIVFFSREEVNFKPIL